MNDRKSSTAPRRERQPDWMLCQACGTAHSLALHDCLHCGAAMSAPAPEVRRRRELTWLVVALGCGLLGAALAAWVTG